MSRRKATVAIGALLKRAREAAGQTQEQRASQVNVALRSLKVAEGGGEVDQQVLCRLIRACGIGPESKLAVDKDWLKQARVSAGLTRSDLAKRTELSEVQVRNIETGSQPLTVRVAARLAGAADIAPPPLTCLEFGGANLRRHSRKYSDDRSTSSVVRRDECSDPCAGLCSPDATAAARDCTCWRYRLCQGQRA
jgi:transcriptional regulator with XRE-family HTH domain